MTLVYDCNCSQPDSDCPHHYELRPEEYDALLVERQQLEATLGLVGAIEYEPEPTVHLSAALYDRYVELCKEHRAERDEWEERYWSLLDAVGGVWPG